MQVMKVLMPVGYGVWGVREYFKYNENVWFRKKKKGSSLTFKKSQISKLLQGRLLLIMTIYIANNPSPLEVLILRKYKYTWLSSACQLHHPEKGKIAVCHILGTSGLTTEDSDPSTILEHDLLSYEPALNGICWLSFVLEEIIHPSLRCSLVTWKAPDWLPRRPR